MTKEEFLTTIYNKKRFGKKSGLDVMKNYTEEFFQPEHGMKIIHIAGTNGKGSTAAAIDCILRSGGFSVGLFTSPHLVKFNERIKFNGEDIGDHDLFSVGEEIMKSKTFSFSTMFDDSLMMALLYFKRKKPDYIILETGIGGRLDSTTGIDNVPLVSVITRIGFDHMKLLGNTLEEIAGEKAGILKSGTRLVLAENEKNVQNVIINEAKRKKIPYFYSDKVDLKSYDLSLPGIYQHENMKNAVLASRLVGEIENKDMESAIRYGLAHTFWPGRIQILSKDPFIILDGAHNPQGVAALEESLEGLFPGEKFAFICGVFADKDYHSMFQCMKNIADEFFTVTIENERALSGRDLAEILKEEGFKAKETNSLGEAFEDARALSISKNEKIVCMGSLYFAGEVLKFFKEKIDKNNVKK
jgi:dihydrofolate synthase/folylpolyglutamate synthase